MLGAERLPVVVPGEQRVGLHGGGQRHVGRVPALGVKNYELGRRRDARDLGDVGEEHPFPMGVELRPARDAVHVQGFLRDRQCAHLRPAQGERFLDLPPDPEVPSGQVAVIGNPTEMEDGKLLGEHLARRDALGEFGWHVTPLPREDHGGRVRDSPVEVKPEPAGA